MGIGFEPTVQLGTLIAAGIILFAIWGRTRRVPRLVEDISGVKNGFEEIQSRFDAHLTESAQYFRRVREIENTMEDVRERIEALEKRIGTA